MILNFLILTFTEVRTFINSQVVLLQVLFCDSLAGGTVKVKAVRSMLKMCMEFAVCSVKRIKLCKTTECSNKG